MQVQIPHHADDSIELRYVGLNRHRLWIRTPARQDSPDPDFEIYLQVYGSFRNLDAIDKILGMANVNATQFEITNPNLYIKEEDVSRAVQALRPFIKLQSKFILPDGRTDSMTEFLLTPLLPVNIRKHGVGLSIQGNPVSVHVLQHAIVRKNVMLTDKWGFVYPKIKTIEDIPLPTTSEKCFAFSDGQSMRLAIEYWERNGYISEEGAKGMRQIFDQPAASATPSPAPAGK